MILMIKVVAWHYFLASTLDHGFIHFESPQVSVHVGVVVLVTNLECKQWYRIVLRIKDIVFINSKKQTWRMCEVNAGSTEWSRRGRIWGSSSGYVTVRYHNSSPSEPVLHPRHQWALAAYMRTALSIHDVPTGRLSTKAPLHSYKHTKKSYPKHLKTNF